MSSLYLPSQTHSLPINCRHASNDTTRTSSAEHITRRRRNESIWQRRCNATSSGGDSSLTECQGKHPFAEEQSLPKRQRTNVLPSLYVDQQTGEMRVVSTGKILNQTLNSAIDLEASRKFSEKQFRCRAQSEIMPKTSRSFWDHSLQTKQIIINSRESDVLVVPKLPHSTISNTMDSFLPRRSRSAESFASSFDFPTRYPRGQQRPSGLVSGHQALLLRHKEIVKASRRLSSAPQRQHQKTPFNLKTRPSLTQRPTQHFTQHLNAMQRFISVQPCCYDRYFKLTRSRDIAMQQGCGHEVRSYTKASKKCEEWFSTWLE